MRYPAHRPAAHDRARDVAALVRAADFVALYGKGPAVVVDVAGGRFERLVVSARATPSGSRARSATPPRRLSS